MFGWWKKKETRKPDETTKEAVVEDFSDVDPLLDYFKGETGIDFDAKREIITRKLINFCRDRKIHGFDDALRELRDNERLKQELIDFLTVNETYFYREIVQIKEVVELVKSSNKKMDILCAPSSTGEEPYTLVMMLLEAGVSPERFHILGIDINADAVARSEKALYRERSLHRLPPQMIQRYFSEAEGGYRLSETVRRCVDFRRMNIFDPAFSQLGKFDVIFSRNMLIYFDKPTKLDAKRRLEALLKDENGRLFFGHADLGGLGF